MPRLVQWIWLLLAAHLAIGGIAYTHFLATGQYTLLTVYFNIEGTPFFLLMTALECLLSFGCCLWLESGDPMRPVWFVLGLAALARTTGSTLHALSALHLPWNWMQWTRLQPLGPFKDLDQLGTIVGSPFSMCLMAVGLALLLSQLRRRRIDFRLTRFDLALIALIVSFTASQVIVIAPLFKQHPNPGVMVLWCSDPLLLMLLVEAVIVRRAVARMGDSLFSRCLGMYVTGILITSLGDAAIWADQHGLLTTALTALSWYIWFVASAAFASAPAYQFALIAQHISQIELDPRELVRSAEVTQTTR